MSNVKKIALALLSVTLVVSLCIPALSFASSNTGDVSNFAEEIQEDKTLENPLVPQDIATTSGEQVSTAADVADRTEASGSAAATGDTPDALPEVTPATDCIATIKYYENVTYEEPGIAPGEGNRYLLGTRTIDGLTKGDVLNAWDYVLDLEGFFFFDGWPANLTVSTNPDENVIELFYGRMWNNSYTVNYYLMEGADLSADNWGDALSPEGVHFTKFASETFDNQPFGELVEGDAYEYKINGTYAVDTYPPEIRVGSDADDNVINVLYVPESPRLPDDADIPDAAPPADGSGSGNEGGIDNGGNNGGTGSAVPEPPADQSFTKDDFAALLPDSMTEQEAKELFEDFIGSTEAEELSPEDEIADDATKTVDPETAKKLIAVYNTGFEHGKADQQPCTVTWLDHIICILIMLVLLVLMLVFLYLYLRERKRTKQFEGDERQRDQRPDEMQSTDRERPDQT